MALLVGTVEQRIARIASRAHGVVTRKELLSAGISSDEIQFRLRIGALIRVYRGVYRVGHRAPSMEASYMAAVKACGGRGVISGLPAARLHRLIKGPTPRPEVTAPSVRRVRGVRTRRARREMPEATTVRGIPVTTVAQTLVDIAPVLDQRALARACHEAGVLHGTTPREVEAVMPRNAPGSKKLRAVMHGDVRVTLSRLEDGFLDELRQANLPLPETNRPAGGRRVDCRWPDHHLTVELLSYRYHRSRHAWEQDHARRREARKRGDEFRQYTWTDVFEEPGPMLAELRQLLARQLRRASAG